MPQGRMAAQVRRKRKSQVLVKVCWVCSVNHRLSSALSSFRVQELCCGCRIAICRIAILILSHQLWELWLCLGGCKTLGVDSSLHEQH